MGLGLLLSKKKQRILLTNKREEKGISKYNVDFSNSSTCHVTKLVGEGMWKFIVEYLQLILQKIDS